MVGSAGAVPFILEQLKGLNFRDSSVLFVLYHRSGDVPFRMEEFARGTRFTIVEAADGVPVEVNRAYYPFRSMDLEVEEGRLRVRPPQHRNHPNIDRLLTSLAREYGPRVLAVLLSGMGRDGIAGLAAVRSAGGYVVVLHPSDARFPQLPSEAASAGVHHEILPATSLQAVVDRHLQGDGKDARAAVHPPDKH